MKIKDFILSRISVPLLLKHYLDNSQKNEVYTVEELYSIVKKLKKFAENIDTFSRNLRRDTAKYVGYVKIIDNRKYFGHPQSLDKFEKHIQALATLPFKGRKA